MAPKPSGKTSPPKLSKKEEDELFKAEVTEVFKAKVTEAVVAKSMASITFDQILQSKAGITLDQALLFDESMLNSWFQETALPISDRADLLQMMRQYKETEAHQSTDAIEGELTSKMLFDALLFAVAFTVPTGVDRSEMQEAWMGDDALYNVSKSHLASYDTILIVMTYLVTTSTGLALIVGFTIYSCLRYERPSSIEEADMFYVRFKVAIRLSYGFTYGAILLAPFSCFELHLIKSPNQAARVFFTYYGFVVYGGLVVFLTWSLTAAHRWRVKLRGMREDLKNRLLNKQAPTQGILPALQRSFSTLQRSFSFSQRSNGLLKKQAPDPTQGILPALQRSFSTLQRSLSSPPRSKRPLKTDDSPAAVKQTSVNSTDRSSTLLPKSPPTTPVKPRADVLEA